MSERVNGMQTVHRLMKNVLRPRLLAECVHTWKGNMDRVKMLLRVGFTANDTRKELKRVLSLWQVNALRDTLLSARRTILQLECKMRGIEEREAAMLKIQQRMANKY